MALSEEFPGYKASASSYDVERHGANVLEREFRAVRESVSNLTSPEGVIVRGGLMGFVRLGMGGVGIGLRVMVRGKVNK